MARKPRDPELLALWCLAAVLLGVGSVWLWCCDVVGQELAPEWEEE